MYVPRTKPRDHQREALERIANRPSRPSGEDAFALLMEMGTGKSKVGIDEFGHREDAGELSDLLVLAPAGSYSNWSVDRGEEWPSEVTKHASEDLRERLAIATWRSGRAESRREVEWVLGVRDRRVPRMLVVNVEALSSVRAARDAVVEFAQSSRRGVLCLADESPVFKNRNAKRVKWLQSVRHLFAARRLLTGLVTPRSPMDLYSQYEFLDWRIIGYRSFVAFQRRFAVTRQLEIPGARYKPRIIVNFQNLDELSERIAPYSFRKLKEDCLDLPKKEYVLRHVEMPEEQRRIYDEMRLFCSARLEGEAHVSATMVMTQRMRLDQILCGFTTDEEGNLREVPERRTDSLLDLLEEVQGKAIIWTTHDYCVRKIADRLRREYGEGSTAQFWGGNRGTRHVDEARFKSDPECRFIVATQAAGGRGNTWTMAGLSVYYNNSDDLEHRLQSEDRTHRDGLTLRALYVDLCAPGTIDERKIRNLRGKIDLASLITRDGNRDWLI